MRSRFKSLSAAAIISLVLLSLFGFAGPAQAQTMTWTNTGEVGSPPVHCFAWGGDTLYAGCRTGRVYSMTGAGNWDDIGEPVNGPVNSLAWDGTDTLYAGGRDGHVYSKKTGEDNWTDTGHLGGPFNSINALAWDGDDTLYAGCGDGHVYSWPGTGDWTDTGGPGTGEDPPAVRALAWDGDETLYAGCENGSVYSKTGSGTWDDDPGPVGPGSGRINALAWDGTDTLYAGCDNGHVYSKTGEGAWDDTGAPGIGNINALTCDGTDTLYAGGLNPRVYSMTDAGGWTDTGDIGADGSINALLWDGTDTLYAGCMDGHVYSKKGEGDWDNAGYTGGWGVNALAWDGDTLYAGCHDNHVYAKTGEGAWYDIGAPGGGPIFALARDGTDTLYAGCADSHVFSKTGAADWDDTGAPGSGEIRALAWDGTDTLSAGCWDGKVYSKTGGSGWTDIGKPGNGPIFALARDGTDTLYAGCADSHVYSKAGSDPWDDTGDTECGVVRALALDSWGTLYAGGDTGVFAGRLAPTITSITPNRGDNSGTVNITNLAGTNFLSGAEVKLTRSGQKDIKATDVKVVSAKKITCRIDLKGAALGSWDVEVKNPGGRTGKLKKGFTVLSAPEPEPTTPVYYLAEGSTAWGFSTYITIENPNTQAVNVKLTYQTVSGHKIGPTITMPALSQATVNPAETVGATDFSTRVECLEGKTIAADRTMTWNFGAGEEAHCSIGVTSPAKTWYMPEGSSEWGFECWVLVQNPNSSPANCTLTYMIEGGDPVDIPVEVPALSRGTWSMAEHIGSKDASIRVTADKPVIPERAMYRNDRREGHDSVGTTTPATDFYLAEGATGYDVGYITYVLVQNPQESPTDVQITYQTQSGEVPGPSFQMPPNSRRTVRVNDQLPPNTDVSTHVHGTRPIIAERSMYWDNGTGEACHDSIGMAEAHTAFYLPDGETSNGRETWTLVQNTNTSAVTVEISYLTPDGKGNVTKTETVPVGSRKTYNMAEHSGISGRAAIMVRCLTPGKKVMVERAMYWNSRGAGTDTIGGFSD